MKPPSFADYQRDYSRLRARMDRAVRPNPTPRDLADAAVTAAEIEPFARRWQPHFPGPEFRAMLDGLRDWAQKNHAYLDSVRTTQLLELVVARGECALCRMMFDFSISFAKAFKETPPADRPTLETIYRKEMGQPYNSEQEFRETEALLDLAEAEFQRCWTHFQTAFPDHATPALRHRLQNANPAELKTWQEELSPRRAPSAAG